MSVRVCVGAAILLSVALAGSRGAEEGRPAAARFREAYRKLIHADQARDQNDLIEALRLYREARDEYVALRTRYPDWDPGTTRFRVLYAANQVESMFGRLGKRDPAEPVIKDPAAKQRDVAFIVGSSKELLRGGNPMKARVLLMEGLRYDPDSWSIRILLGTAQCQAGRFRDAAAVARELVRERPRDVASRMLLAGAWYGLGQYEEAERELQKVLEMKPDSGDAHFNLAQVFLRKQEPDEKRARKHYRRALALGSAPDAELGTRLKVKPAER